MDPPLPEGAHVDLCFLDGALVRYVAYPPGGKHSATLEVLDPRTLQLAPTQYQLPCPSELQRASQRTRVADLCHCTNTHSTEHSDSGAVCAHVESVCERAIVMQSSLK